MTILSCIDKEMYVHTTSLIGESVGGPDSDILTPCQLNKCFV